MKVGCAHRKCSPETIYALRVPVVNLFRIRFSISFQAVSLHVGIIGALKNTVASVNVHKYCSGFFVPQNLGGNNVGIGGVHYIYLAKIDITVS